MRAVSHDWLAQQNQLLVSFAALIAIILPAQRADIVDFEVLVAVANDTLIADRPDRLKIEDKVDTMTLQRGCAGA